MRIPDREMEFFVLVIDESLGETKFVKHLLEELDQVSRAIVVANFDDYSFEESPPDVLILGASWLHMARRFRKQFPVSKIIGRGPWQGDVEAEFYPWGDELRDPTLPLTSLIPRTL